MPYILHLADAFIQSDLQSYSLTDYMDYIQSIHFKFFVSMCSLGIEPKTFALLTQCSNHWATGKPPYIKLFAYIIAL